MRRQPFREQITDLIGQAQENIACFPCAGGMGAVFRADDPEVPWRQLWVLVVFSLWHQIYVEHVFDPVALGWQG